MNQSEERRNKLKTYIGFAKKAGKIVYGVDQIVKIRRRYLILTDPALSANSQKKIAKHASETGSTILTADDLAELFGENVKAVAVKEEHLAEAIASILKENQSISGGV